MNVVSTVPGPVGSTSLEVTGKPRTTEARPLLGLNPSGWMSEQAGRGTFTEKIIIGILHVSMGTAYGWQTGNKPNEYNFGQCIPPRHGYLWVITGNFDGAVCALDGMFKPGVRIITKEVPGIFTFVGTNNASVRCHSPELARYLMNNVGKTLTYGKI